MSRLNKPMQYETPSSNLPILKYGRKMEERVRENYYTLVGPYHLDFGITKTGLYISSDYPHLNLSPDGIVDCDCCVKGNYLKLNTIVIIQQILKDEKMAKNLLLTHQKI